MRRLQVLSAHPGVTLQDGGRPGLLARGISAGGAADPLALAEAAALLGAAPDDPGFCAIEMAGHGGRFRLAGGAGVIALTGAPMRAEIAEGDGTRRLAWPGSHALAEGAELRIGPADTGVYGYLAVDGGPDTPRLLGARSAHLAAGIGAALSAGDALPLGPPRGARPGLTLDPLPRFDGGMLRLLPGAQTAAFPADQLARLQAESFARDPRANRQGVRLQPEGGGFGTEAGLSVTSEAIVPGDIQIVGGGAPFILLAECQTTGGYPRIGTVISADLPAVAQAPPGARFRFRFVSLEEALAARADRARHVAALPGTLRPVLRDPRDIPDLLAYQLIGGVTSGQPDDASPD